MIYARSSNAEGDWQTLEEHSLNVANIMKNFTSNFTYKELFYITGLLHDFGKSSESFQQRLNGSFLKFSHAPWGAFHAKKLSFLYSYIPIYCHHMGLMNLSTIQESLEGLSDEDYLKILEKFLTVFPTTITAPLNPSFRTTLDAELFIRYISSSLVDADRLDAEAHHDKEKVMLRKIEAFDFQCLIERLTEEFSNKPKEGELNKLRNKVKEEILSKTDVPVGFYSMILPTGMGKTLASVAWALEHSKKHNLKRIIIVLPYTNIIDQTAKELKRIFGEDKVLEHHSSFNEDTLEEETVKERFRLVSENWDFPIIVTTTNQFFESLVSDKPKKYRKIHNIADSVVIFDEVQTFPKSLIAPTLSLIESIKEVMNTSFLFCTATQPAFEKREGFSYGLKNIVPLIEDSNSIFLLTKRVTYNLLNNCKPLSIKEVVDTIKEGSTLCIFNVKKNASEAFTFAKQKGLWDKVYYLTTALCPDHRKKVIANIIKDLKEKRKIFVASTQLVEAGVDFDFPCVYREIAPLDSIIQSAGRCNREGKMKGLGEVFIFEVKKGKFPDSIYRTLSNETLMQIKNNIGRLDDYTFYSEYYRTIFKNYIQEDEYRINEDRKKFNFEAVANRYKIIEENTKEVFVMNYSKESASLMNEIEQKGFVSIKEYRVMQRYTVQLYTDSTLELNRRYQGNYRINKLGIYIWIGIYDKELGISI